MIGSRPAHVAMDQVVDFDIYDPPGVAEDYHLAWRALQRPDGPSLLWTPRNGGHWIVVRGEPMMTVWSDHENFSSQIQMVPKADAERNRLLPSYLDPPRYGPYRKIVEQALSPRRMMNMEGSVRQRCIALIESFAKGRCDFVKQYAEQLPIGVFMSMCDLPMEDAPTLKLWTDRMLSPDGTPREEVVRFFADYLGPVIDERRAQPGDDVISALANGRIGAEPVSRDEALQICSNVLFAGLDTVVNFLSFVMRFLATNPEHRAQLANNRRQIPRAVEEFVRRFPIVTQARMAMRDMEFAGATIREGEVIVIPSALHGLDDMQNDCPLEVDFDRRNRQHSTFGAGAHSCVGLLLAKMEVRATLEEWFARIPDFTIEPGREVICASGMVGKVIELPLAWDTTGEAACDANAATAVERS